MFFAVNVNNNILATDFLSYFRLLLDIQEKQLVQSAQPVKQPSVATIQVVIQSSNSVMQLLSKLPSLTTPVNYNVSASHKVKNHQGFLWHADPQIKSSETKDSLSRI